MFLLLFLSLAGMVTAAFLRYQYTLKVKFGKKAYCLIGSNCFEVTSSKYGWTFGIKNEDLGIGYYLLLISLIFYSLASPDLATLVATPIFIAALAALIFSLYLLSVQTFFIKKYCFLCQVNLAINLSIFLVSWFLLINL